MKNLIRTVLCISVAYLLAVSAAIAADQPAAKPEAKAEELKVSIEADDARVKDLFGKVAEQSKQRILMESTVTGAVKNISAKDVTVEAALTTICKLGKCEWRKVYLPSDSKLLEQPDKLASTVRLVTAMGFPDIVVSAASNGKLAAHYVQEKNVKAAQDIALADSNLVGVYVITNDIAVAEKENTAEQKSPSKEFEDYIRQQKEMMDKFVKMSPEDQEQAIVAGINMFEQMDPSYMASAMRAMSRVDPEVFSRMSNRGTEMLLSMSQEDRRAFLKMSMRTQMQIKPEVLQMLQEDSAAVMEELQREGALQPNP